MVTSRMSWKSLHDYIKLGQCPVPIVCKNIHCSIHKCSLRFKQGKTKTKTVDESSPKPLPELVFAMLSRTVGKW